MWIGSHIILIQLKCREGLNLIDVLWVCHRRWLMRLNLNWLNYFRRLYKMFKEGSIVPGKWKSYTRIRCIKHWSLKQSNFFDLYKSTKVFYKLDCRFARSRYKKDLKNHNLVSIHPRRLWISFKRSF